MDGISDGVDDKKLLIEFRANMVFKQRSDLELLELYFKSDFLYSDRYEISQSELILLNCLICVSLFKSLQDFDLSTSTAG